MTMYRIHFIGSGHLARCLIQGLTSHSQYRLSVSSPTISEKSTFKHVLTHTSNTHFLSDVEMVIIAVKPEKVRMVCDEIAGEIKPEQIIVSLAAGTKLSTIASFFPSHQAVVRVMPNIAAQFNQSATAWYSDTLNKVQMDRVEAVFKALGVTVEVNSDNQIDIATALCGSSPAFFYKFVDALVNSAMQAGLPQESAMVLASQAMYGAMEVSMKTKQDYTSLSSQVASKKGTTEAGLRFLSDNGLKDLVEGALKAAIKRAEVLATS